MGSLPHSEQVHEFFKSNRIFELECSLTDILKMFRRYEITHSIEYLFQGGFGDFSIYCVQIENFHEGLSLRRFYGVLVLSWLLIL